MNNIIVLVFFLFVCSGCVQMRDWTGKKNGGVVVFSKTEFGQGQSDRDYYMIDDNNYVIIDDTKNEILAKLGSPDSMSSGADGHVDWVYLDKKVTLVFEGDCLKHWHPDAK